MLPDPFPYLHKLPGIRYRPHGTEYRILINDQNLNKHFPNNEVVTSKYTWWSFIPKSLVEQFRKISNIYFLLILCIQLIPGISPIVPLASILPLAFVVGIAMLKEAVEDYKRHKADLETNEMKFQVKTPTGFEDVRAKKLHAGTVVRIKDGEFFPADMVLLWSSHQDGVAYIETANLDGETSLKLRKSLEQIQSLPDSQLAQLHDQIETELPHEDLYRFQAKYIRKTNGDEVIPLETDHFLQRGAQLRNTDFIYAVPVYLGRDTKLSLNQKRPRTKFSRMERSLNWTVLGIFIAQQIICIFFGIASGVFKKNNRWPSEHWYLGGSDYSIVVTMLRNYVSYFILLNIFIPISLWITLELVKFCQAKFMERDVEMSVFGDDGKRVGMIAKTSNLNEDLGRIEMIFSDKTGTLTQNRMTFRTATVRGVEFPQGTPMPLDQGGENKKLSTAVRQFLRVLSLCHNLVPATNAQNQMEYRTPSPDELALAECMLENHYRFAHRTQQYLTVNENGVDVRYELLAELRFSSARRRMSVVVRSPNGKVELLMKGADDVINARLEPTDDVTILNQRTQINSQLAQFGTRGYRTLLMARRSIPAEELAQWLPQFTEASTAVGGREEKLTAVYELIETRLKLVGGSAVEDLLADQVPQTIEFMHRGNIQIWMLTGDKLETAVNIGYSTALFRPDMEILQMKEMRSEAECESLLRENLRKHPPPAEDAERVAGGGNLGLVIDGSSLKFALSEKNGKLFVELSRSCRSVVCCRMTPLQKADVVRAVKKFDKKISLAIGDGANDVSMIQEAHVGVGIFGKEGRQAALASDYAIHEFKHLKRLLFVHGRWCTMRNAGLIHSSFFKNLAFSFPQVYFAFFTGFSATSLHDQWLITFYNAFFTFLPPFIFGLFEQDLPAKLCLKYPEAYRRVQEGRLYSWYTISYWLANALWIGSVCFWIPYAVWRDSDAVIKHSGRAEALTTFGLICTIAVTNSAILRIGFEYRYWSYMQVIGVIGSLAVFWLFLFPYSVIIYMKQGIGQIYLTIYYLFGTPLWWILTTFLIILSLSPDLIGKLVQWYWFPFDWQVLRERYKLGMEEGSDIELKEKEAPRTASNHHANGGNNRSEPIEMRRVV